MCHRQYNYFTISSIHIGRIAGFKSGEGTYMTIVHYKQRAGFSPRKTVLVLIFHVRRTHSLLALMLVSLLGPTCYLELARGFTYTLHVSPPRDGGPTCWFLVPLKGLPRRPLAMSRHICCLSCPKVRLLLHAGELPGSHVVLVSVNPST